MAGILIDYSRFVEVQQRRARIAAELGQEHQTPASRTRVAPIDHAVEAGEPPPTVVDTKMTRGVVDVR